ncbi:unannotated protein [freshwater metagenome]|uniref:Unannotated protein n=1 Tax=freshwater metagenome TaxID=449393 RepID=A0A6J7HYT9_9ZZZZ
MVDLHRRCIVRSSRPCRARRATCCCARRCVRRVRCHHAGTTTLASGHRGLGGHRGPTRCRRDSVHASARASRQRGLPDPHLGFDGHTQGRECHPSRTRADGDQRRRAIRRDEQFARAARGLARIRRVHPGDSGRLRCGRNARRRAGRCLRRAGPGAVTDRRENHPSGDVADRPGDTRPRRPPRYRRLRRRRRRMPADPARPIRLLGTGDAGRLWTDRVNSTGNTVCADGDR